MNVRHTVLIVFFVAESAFAQGLPGTQSLVYTTFDYAVEDKEKISAHEASVQQELNAVSGTLKQPPKVREASNSYFAGNPFDGSANRNLTTLLTARMNTLRSYIKPDQSQVHALNNDLVDALIRQSACRKKCRDIRALVEKLTQQKDRAVALLNQRKRTAGIEQQLVQLHLTYVQEIRKILRFNQQRKAVNGRQHTQFKRRPLDTSLPSWATLLEKQREAQKLAQAEAARNHKLLLNSIESACSARKNRLEFARTYEKQARDVETEVASLKTQQDESEVVTAWTEKIDELVAAAQSGGNVSASFDEFHRKLTKLFATESARKAANERTYEQRQTALSEAINSLRKSRSAVPVTTLDTDSDPCAPTSLSPDDSLELAQYSAAEAAVNQEEQRVALHKQEAAVAQIKLEMARHNSDSARSLLRRVLPHLSTEYDQQVFSYNALFYEHLMANLLQLGTDVVDHVKKRLVQIRNLPSKATSWTGFMAMVSALFWLLLIMMIGRAVFRRADGWILGFHDWAKSIRTLQPVIRLMHTLTKLVSVIAHPGLVWVTWWFAADYLGFDQPEVWIAYTVVMWVLLYQCLRQVSRALFTGPQWIPERAVLLGPVLDRAPVFKLQPDTAIKCERSLHLITLYILLRIAVLATVEALLGQNYLYHLAVDVVATAKWAVAVALVVWWRERVVRAYIGSGISLLSEQLDRHKNKVWMAVIVPFLLVAILATRTVPWLQDTFSKTGAFGAFITFLSRRRMEQAVRQSDTVKDGHSDLLPKDYIEKFELAELTDEPYLMTPFSRLQEISDLYAFWAREKREGSLAIIGETGIGKSTLINLALATLPVDPKDVLRGKPAHKLSTEQEVIEFLANTFGFNPIPKTLHDLEQAILADKKPVVVIDDAHHFFLKKMGGMEALDAFVHVVTVTCTNVFWITAFNSYSWFFIKNLNRSEPPFRHIMMLDSWTPDEIEGLIMARNAATGYDTDFQDLVVDRGEGDNTLYEVIKTKRSYFRLLGDLAGGNPSVALRYWLHSLRKPPDVEKLVRVGLYNPAPPKALVEASEDVLFALTCIAEHASLSADELAAVLRMSPGSVHRMLSYCEEHHLITRSNGAIMLDLANYGQITRTLSMRSFIYFQHEQAVSS